MWHVRPDMAADRAQEVSSQHVLGDFLVDGRFPDLAAQLDPSTEQVANIKRLAALLCQVFERFPGSWKVLSGFRDQPLNEACRKAGLPASIQSLHLAGCAADLQPDDEVDLEAVFDWIAEVGKNELAVHEAVYYPNKNFIHLGVKDPKQDTSKKVLMRL